MNVRGCTLLTAIVLSGCMTTQPEAGGPALATASIRNAAGVAIGTASLTADGDALRLTVSASGLTPGNHGIHLHTVGRCDGPDFASAGAHLNPNARQHGLENPQGSHAGDLPNLVVAANGSGTLTRRWPVRAAEVLDADGTAIVIHAAADDQRTDPSGNSGGRIACGVFARP